VKSNSNNPYSSDNNLLKNFPSLPLQMPRIDRSCYVIYIFPSCTFLRNDTKFVPTIKLISKLLRNRRARQRNFSLRQGNMYVIQKSILARNYDLFDIHRLDNGKIDNEDYEGNSANFAIKITN